jgi:hypothetical protein
MAGCKGDFLMSYDNTAETAALAKKHGFESRAIGPPGSSSRRLTHLLVGKNLDVWLP